MFLYVISNLFIDLVIYAKHALLWWLDWRRSIVNSHELYARESDMMLFLTSSHALLSHELPSDSHPTLNTPSNDLSDDDTSCHTSLTLGSVVVRLDQKKVDILNSITRDSG